MKRIHALLLIIFALFFVTTSCSDKNDPIDDSNKGTLIRATFNPSSEVFTLFYSKGATETVKATIDKTVTPPTATATLKDGTVISVKDATKEGIATIGPIPPTVDENKYVNNWIFEEMNIYYLWNNKIPKSPDYSMKPDKFFNSLLYTYNKNSNPEGDRFSWIQ